MEVYLRLLEGEGEGGGERGVSVYVDDMRAPYGRMVMSHMVADTVEELHAMADRIGVARRWYQDRHYDICQSKRALAVKYGAREVTRREAVKARAKERK